ncbi:MAG: FapA family protein [Lachnospiraceae bacterium]|nr:FapA family protein [Lachnospiraceae bacterium]
MNSEQDTERNDTELDVDDILQVLNSWEFPDTQEQKVERIEQEKRESYVYFRNNDMEAWLSLAPPSPGEVYTLDQVRDFLKKKGVKTGIIDSSVKAMIRKRVYNRATKVAVGIESLEGKNGYYQFYFQREHKRPAPSVRENGTVDYGSFHLIESVQKDDILALYHPATKGKPGCDVHGKFIFMHPGKDLPPLRGKGFYRHEGSNAYYAAQDGKVEYHDGEIEIRSTHVVDGDVTLTTGRVEFFGDIVIYGSVEAGVSIKTGRTLTITGTVGPCDIFAGGDVVLKKGVQGANRAKIITRGVLYADFIEHSYVEAKKGVCANVIMNSNVIVDEKVTLTGSNGAIIGGYTHANEAIDIKRAGNDAEIRTILHVGERPHSQLEKKKEINVFNTDAQSLFRQLKNSEKVENPAYIRIDGDVYRGTVVCVDENQHVIREKTSFMEYRNVHGQLTEKVIVD